MRRYFALVALTSTLFLNGCKGKSAQETLPPSVAGEAQSQGRVLFSFEDPKEDDRGMGHYIYPVPLQSSKVGIFDLTRFQVLDRGERVELVFDFRRPVDFETIDGQTFAKGYAYQLIDVYIDKDRRAGSGLNEALPGRNLEFRADEAWDKAIVITPGPSHEIRDAIDSQSDLRQFWLKRKDIYVPNDVYAGSFRITAHVPKSEIGEPHPEWGWQVLVMGYDPLNLTRYGLYNSEVQTFATERYFGGGTDYQGETSAIDVLAPSAESQYRVLSRYRSGPVARDNTWAILPMIYLESLGKDKQKILQDRRNVMTQPSVEILREPDLRGIEPRYREGMQ